MESGLRHQRTEAPVGLTRDARYPAHSYPGFRLGQPRARSHAGVDSAGSAQRSRLGG